MALFVVDSGVARIIRDQSRLAVGLLVGGIALCGVGVVDDVKGVRAAYKLAVQIVVAVIAFTAGFRIDAVHVPLFGALSMGVFALPVTVFWIVGITNAVNLIDGLDGLAAGVVFFAAGTNFAVAWISTNVFVAVLMAAVMGALIAFLFYNFNPARIFMGDSGSYFLGFVLAATSLTGASHKASTAVSLLVPIVALGVPIFDTLFSMVRRMLERRPLFSPDRGHIHHRLLDMGITHRRAVMILYGVSVTMTIAAIGISLDRQWETGIALVCATLVMVGLVRFTGYFEYLQAAGRQRKHLYDRHAEGLRRVVPALLQRMSALRSEDEVWEELCHLAEDLRFACVEILVAEDSGERLLQQWTAGENVRDLVTARFAVSGGAQARAILRFSWSSDTAQVSPQCDILLQIVVDAVERALTRAASDLVPGPERDESVRASTPRPVLGVRP